MNFPCDLIAEQMGQLFDCVSVNGYVRIRTPFLYPDGDLVDLYFRETDRGMFLSDLGSTLMWLNAQTLVERRTKRQLQIVHDVCVTHNVQFSDGALWRNFTTPELADAVTNLALAAVSVADISFTLRSRPVSSIKDEVAEFLTEHRVPFRMNERVAGYSLREFTIDFFTYPPNRNSYVALLSTDNSSTALELAEKTLGIWRDLDVLKQMNGSGGTPPKFVTLFDDTHEVWRPEHYRMLARDSEIAHWSDPSDFLRTLEVLN
jgi:hypothetical protein